MSLFKRKQSKEKDVAGESHNHAQVPSYSPPVNAAPTMPTMVNGQPGSRGPSGAFPQANGSTPPMVSGRRMTSNPLQGPPVNGVNGYPNHSNGPPMPQHDNPPPPQQYSSPQQQSGVLPRPQSTAPTTNYPWSTRPIRLYPAQTSPPSAPQSPFPRYGLSVPAFPSHSGHMLLFGGLVHEAVRNDMWSMDVRDCSTMPVKTKGDAPKPRVGHASAIADRILLIWGGDTKMKPDDRQDEALYVLDLRTQEWTIVPVARGPIGRYGHAVCMLDTRFYVFGGQAEGQFMNDLWAYDIRQLSSDKQHVWEQIQFTTPAPPRRTGHILVSSQGKLYLFGGTDGNFHYNDTWCLDLTTGAWSELSCIGYIPVPREGHAAAVVDNVIYIFGGRDVNGKDLGDLAAFRITNQRWYMFQNMGPAPSARSGHAMVAAHGKIFVLGGESNAVSGANKDDPSLVHVLDTVKIKYPADTQPPKQANQAKPRGQEGPVQQESAPPPNGTPQSMRTQIPPSSSMDSLNRAASPPTSSDRLVQMVQAPAPPLAAPIEAREIPRSQAGDLSQGRQPNGPPQRPRREGDDEFRRAMSPQNGPSSPQQSGFPVRVTSPTNQGPSSPPQNVKHGFNPSILGTRSPSPRLRNIDTSERPAPPPDAFYYGRSPTANGFNRPGSVSGSSELLRELKAKEGEIDAGKQREAALRAIIGKAIHQGFVTDEEEFEPPDGNADNELVRKLTDALIRIKQDKATIQNELVTQIRAASDRAMEAERLRRGAIQEAAYFRAKVATLESNSPIDLGRIEKERMNELEKQISTLSAEHGAAQRELDRAREVSTTNQNLQSAAAEREAETLRRAEEAEEAHRQATQELDELQTRASGHETSLREHGERLISLSSISQQREAERDNLQAQLNDAVAVREEHLGLIGQAQEAISAAGLRTAEMESLHAKSSARVEQLEQEMVEVRSELEARTREVQAASDRLNEVENAYAKSREEADSLRKITTGQLSAVLESHKELRADEGRTTRGHQEQLRALEDEGKSLRKMLKEAGQRLDAAEGGVAHHRQKARDLETSHQTLRAEMRSHRTKLLASQQELARYKDLHSAKDGELRDRDVAVTEIETRCTMLRNLLADHGIAVSDNDLSNAETSTSRELEAKLRERTRAHDNAQREVEELTRRCHEAEDKVESLGRLVDRMKDARSPTSMSIRSPTPPQDSDRRIMDAERRIQEMENQHKEKIHALESDYQTAVRYVKGTEKMLKRMKDELNKQKAANTTLQAELDTMRGRDPNARSGRATPSSSDPEFSRRLEKLQGQYNSIQTELAVSRDALASRDRELEVLRMRCEAAEREVEVLREDLAQAQQRINTLLEMNGQGFGLHSEDESETEGPGRRGSAGSSEEASMAFDKFTKELKQWERSRSPQHTNGNGTGDQESDDDTAQQPHQMSQKNAANHAQHRRHSSEYSGDWVQ